MYLLRCLNPLCIVECFRSESFSGRTRIYEVLIHCVSWNAFGAPKCLTTTRKRNVLIHCVSWNAFGEYKNDVSGEIGEVLIHCMSWNAFGLAVAFMMGYFPVS